MTPLRPARQPEVLNKVLDKLSTGKMPPPGLPPIAKAEVAVVTSWDRRCGEA